MPQQAAFESEGIHVTIGQLARSGHGWADYLGGPGVALEGPCGERAQRCAGREAVLGPVQRPHHAHAGRVRGVRLRAPGLQYLNLSNGTVSQTLLSTRHFGNYKGAALLRARTKATADCCVTEGHL